MPPSVGVNFQSVFTSCQFDSDKLRPPPPLKPTSLTVVWTPFFSCLNDCETMLIKTRLGELQKFVRLTEPNLKEFLTAASSEEGSCQQGLGGPAARRDTKFVPETVLSEEECKEAIALIKHSADEDTIKKKMKLTFDFRRNMVLDPQRSSNILSVFPRFKDVKGLVEQDFVLMFGEDVSGKFLEKWTTTFKRKIIQQCRELPTTSDLEELLLAADTPEDSTEVDDDMSWDSDLSSILLLLHLIPPSALGRKRPGKMSASQAEKRLVVFKKIGTNIQEHLDAITTSTQPYLHQFFIILDKNAIACRSTSSLGAFDELFKAHYVFATTYMFMATWMEKLFALNVLCQL
ncbi:uncharacterized protein LOC129370504 isoform X1 [Poeciliopsis prolifica]|uniref:uncharacterized protein LOC129370504 isoform X1 n=1 Tax=Poeciliopsis prolifica TaxID=188132 RepID=UPI0024134654|nr:uncharacterized protein LOC129370504 isoform X1 [Poeciliopsis prolifica]